MLVEAGALLFLEHVRGDTRQLAWWQDRLERPWGWIAGGCHPNRPTGHLLADAGFWIEQLDRGPAAEGASMGAPDDQGDREAPVGGRLGRAGVDAACQASRRVASASSSSAR